MLAHLELRPGRSAHAVAGEKKIHRENSIGRKHYQLQNPFGESASYILLAVKTAAISNLRADLEEKTTNSSKSKNTPATKRSRRMYATTKLAEDTPLNSRIDVIYSAIFFIASSSQKKQSMPDRISLPKFANREYHELLVSMIIFDMCTSPNRQIKRKMRDEGY